jgi:aspartyl-tRNA(Asn)/glutamyl-tRNA(Gln) amidotransferase subunit B
MGELLRVMKERGVAIEQVPVTPQALAGLIALVDGGVISGTAAKEVFARMYESRRPAADIVEEHGLAQTSDEQALELLVREAIASNPGAVAEIRKGRRAAFGFLVGQVMKASKGRANPRVVNQLLERALEE